MTGVTSADVGVSSKIGMGRYCKPAISRSGQVNPLMGEESSLWLSERDIPSGTLSSATQENRFSFNELYIVQKGTCGGGTRFVLQIFFGGGSMDK